MKRRRKSPHSLAHGNPPAVQFPVPVDASRADTGQILLQFSHTPRPMTPSQQDDPLISAATEPAAEFSSDTGVPEEPSVQTPDAGRELFAMPSGACEEPVESLGMRLRAAREKRDLTADEVASRLRLPQHVVRTLESGDYARIEHDVYLRGYLASYARLLGIAPTECVAQLDRSTAPSVPTLVATGRISHSRYLFERYSVPAVYVVLTALIVAPAVWLASHGGLEQNFARLAPLDGASGIDGGSRAAETLALPTPSRPDRSDRMPAPVSNSAKPQVPASDGAADAPLMASLASFPTLTEGATQPPSPQASASGRRLHLFLSEASWVEIIGSDGHRYEFGLLPAGSQRDYATSDALTVRLGNATGAELQVGGKALEIGLYRRANVAHFKLVDGQPAPILSDN